MAFNDTKNYTVATITYLHSDNFGSVLQTYALNKVLINMGYNAYVIDYKKEVVDNLYKIFKPNNSFYNFATNIYSLLNYKKLNDRKIAYSRFRKEYIKKSNVQYHTYSELKEKHPKADCYICGSDQIWNLDIVDFDDSYLLSFVEKGKKISYAASGICDSTSDSNIKKIVEHTNSFDYISVRENIAKEKLEKLSNSSISVVLDPVFLLNRKSWEDIAGDSDYIKEPYMLCYFAGGVSNDFEKYTYNLSKKLKLKRVIIMPEWRNIFRIGKKYYNSGPVEFLTLFKYASFVCTNSFHGTSFSILFNKPFIVGLHKPYTEDRINTLLSFCNLSDQEIDPANDPIKDAILNIDFNFANKKIEMARSKCRQWLKNAIEGEV